MYEGTLPAFTLYMNESLSFVFYVIELHIHTLNLVNPVTSRAVSFWIVCSVTESCSEHPSNTTDAYSTIGNR